MGIAERLAQQRQERESRCSDLDTGDLPLYRQHDWWDPEPNETLIGTLLAVETVQSSDYGQYDVATLSINHEPGIVCLPLLRKVLRRRWEKAGPNVGDEVGIEYLGLVEGGPRPYHDYSEIVVERAPADLPSAQPSLLSDDYNDPFEDQ